MAEASFGLPASIKRIGHAIPGALDRHQRIVGFDQEAYSRASVLCIGAGGLISFIAPTLCRKGIGRLTVFDRDVVEASNLNRQMFFASKRPVSTVFRSALRPVMLGKWGQQDMGKS